MDALPETESALESPDVRKARRDALREDLVSRIPAWYSPWIHLAFPSIVGVGVIVACLVALRDPTPLEWLLVPAVFLLSNASEWRIHRDLLHRRTPPLETLYYRHTPQHHGVYHEDDMAMRSRREFRLVLLPAYAVLLIVVGTSPVTAALWWWGHWNLACLWVATTTGYVVSYEWLHLSYHLAPDGPIGRLWLVRVLRRHHGRHHRPELMQRWNFNVSLPLWDWVRGTIHREAA